uniref:Uncharacterized protein n=1 Tax=Haptolina brevifila TaxID=156173 RepID=A0A7S2IJ18_9EUKA
MASASASLEPRVSSLARHVTCTPRTESWRQPVDSDTPSEEECSILVVQTDCVHSSDDGASPLADTEMTSAFAFTSRLHTAEPVKPLPPSTVTFRASATGSSSKT